MEKMKWSNQGFTLIELIIVLTIIAILSTMAAVSYVDQQSTARDARRSMDAQILVNQLAANLKANGQLQIPNSPVTLYAINQSSIVGYQGYLGAGIRDQIGIRNGGNDPLGFDYTYMVNATKTNFELLVYYENIGNGSVVFENPLISKAYAAPQYSMLYPATYGDKIGMVYQTATKIPVQEIPGMSTSGFDVMSGALLSSYTVSSSYQNCPPGWIGVPGDSGFRTSSFCVMKYEAKALNGTVNSGYNGHNYTDSDVIVSNATDVPIVSVTQPQAIAACKSIGAHLITNNEWMTIARNIEQNPSNWSTGIVGSGYIYNGHVNSNPYTSLSAGSSDADGLNGMTGGFGASSSYNNRRTLYLSNGNVIWDLSGNVWEHVNKANTLDATDIDSNSINVESACNNGTWNWWSWYSNDGNAECGYMNGYSRALFGPLGAYNANNGVGRIYATNTEDRSNIFLRGGAWHYASLAGVFTLHLTWNTSDANGSVGFRCAK